MEGKKELMIGLLVLVALAALGGLIMSTGDLDLFKEYYPVTVYFDTVTGLQPDTPVRMTGVNIGKVKSIELDGQELGAVKVILLIESSVNIKKDSRANITSTGIIGENYVDFSFAKNDGDNLAQDGSAVLKGETSISFEEIKNSLAKLMATVNTEQVSADFQEILFYSKNTFKEADVLLHNLNELHNSNKDEIQATLTNIEAGAASIRTITEKISQALDATIANKEFQKDVRRIVSNGNDTIFRMNGAIDSLDKTLVHVSDLVSSGKDTLSTINDNYISLQPKINRIAQNIEDITTNAKVITNDLEKGEGLLGKILHDENLSYNMTVIMNNVTGFSNKLDEWSKHPARLIKEYLRASKQLKKEEKEEKKKKKKNPKANFGTSKKLDKKQIEKLIKELKIKLTKELKEEQKEKQIEKLLEELKDKLLKE